MLLSNRKARLIAFYLPQFHPIPENDKWWGKGFTEWTNVGKAKPLFKGHYQPKVPADLGYYDLRVPEVREAQAHMAKEAGIEGFMYWHYWFGKNKTLLERPFLEVLTTGKPDYPFCLGWANHSWANKTWSSDSQYSVSKMLIEQEYGGVEDYTAHFYHLLPAFKDNRYIRVNNKPFFLIYAPNEFRDIKLFMELWNKLAVDNGIDGIHFVAQAAWDKDMDRLLEIGVDAVCRAGLFDALYKMKSKAATKILNKVRTYTKFAPLNRYDYKELVLSIEDHQLDKVSNIYPSVISNFDHTPRSGRKGLILDNSTPQLFQQMLRNAVQSVAEKNFEDRIIILRSWNEWAEGNYVEPDLKYGHTYLDAIRNEIYCDTNEI